MIGVLPVAISTIMVSPTARPMPIISAEKMPGLAVRITTRVMVCHGVAPRASEPRVRCLRHAENGVFGDGEDIAGSPRNPWPGPTTSELR